MIERHVIEIRKEMHEKRLQDEEHRKQFGVTNSVFSSKIEFSRFFSQREYESARFERSKAEHERTRKEEEWHRLKEIALKEQEELHEKRSQALVDDFIRMKSLTVEESRRNVESI